MTYQVINIICNQSDAALSAAEAHGIATGMLCINAQTKSDRWLAELFRNVIPVNEEEKQQLIRLFEETGELLASDQFEFELFLPEDNTLLTEQVMALKSWCQGFLYGVGSAYSDFNLTGDAGEILKDIAEFTKLDIEAEGEEDEAAFIEITEYLRSAVLLLREELNVKTPRIVH
jgi:uncharacterized protein YgfB (UPF0149 family)